MTHADAYSKAASGIRSRKCASGQSRLTVVRKNSIPEPRPSTSQLCAPSTTSRARVRLIRLLRIARDNSSGVPTRTLEAAVSAARRSYSKSTSTAEGNCST